VRTSRTMGQYQGMRRAFLGMFILGVGVLVLLGAMIISGRGEERVAEVAAGGQRRVLAVAPLSVEEVPAAACIEQLSCLRQWYQTLAWELGPEAALKALDQHGLGNEKLREVCHDTTHAIGEVAAYMRSLSEAMGLGDSNCGSGYYHGVIATTTTKVSPEKLVDVLVSGCSAGIGFGRWECFHGVGHGFVFSVNGDIFKGIEKCEEIADDSDRGACGSGAFMQELVDHGQNEKYASDPYVVCRKMRDTTIAGQCYDMLANIIRIHRSTPAEEFEVCRTVDSAYENDCYRGLGRARFAGMPFEGAGIEEYCNQAGSAGVVTLCYEAAYSNTSAYYGNSEEAKSHCPELSTEALRKSCEEYLTSNPL
jgi:hypothetical protein